MPCCAASGSAGRINPWSVWIRSWEVSKIGRKKATLLCPRHGFCFFVWFSAVFCESFMAQAFFQEWKETIGRPRCRLATDLHLGTPWALLGHSLGTPWILRITGIPRFRPGSSAKRSAKPKSTNSFRHTTSAHGFAHGLHAVYMLLHAADLLFDSFRSDFNIQNMRTPRSK